MNISDRINLSQIYIISSNEFDRIMGHPLIIVVSCLLFIITLLNAMGGSHLLSELEETAKCDIFIRYGFGQIFYITSLLCTVVALFLGVTSMAEDRSNNYLNNLLTKPLYRRDVIIGKFLGINVFLMLLIIVSFLGCSFFLMIFYKSPDSFVEYILRVSSLILALFFECSLTVGIAMFIGIAFKNLVESIAVAMTYLFVEYYGFLNQYVETVSYLRDLQLLSPHILYYMIFNGNERALLIDTSVSYLDWFNAAMPFIILIVLEIFVFLLLDCTMFTKFEET
ncbi:ABC transporter permease [Methanocella conradii]|uniref:ABC transporter permease n=1 Tax=Methanocella conradii TaxID=1175444 RepID=UPI0024B3B8DD|nr:ABC transporter permease subunit [Methanocella conradii]MDI6897872.1 ABC transporter permease subunit [Methanocella conradii]